MENHSKKPWEQILKNAGIFPETIQKQIEKEEYNTIYNVASDTWESSRNTKVMNPFLVVMHALINATSIAGMLLTTTSLIINEYKNDINKESEYSNW